MFTRIIKSVYKPTYEKWLKENNYSILSSRHRGIYAEMIFMKFCKDKEITAVKINPFIGVLDQIDTSFLKKIQQKELKKQVKIGLKWYCVQRKKGFFVETKMGTSSLPKQILEQIKSMEKNTVFEFRVFEDGDIFIKKKA